MPKLGIEDQRIVNKLKKGREELFGRLRTAGALDGLLVALSALLDEARDEAHRMAIELYEQAGVPQPAVIYDDLADAEWDIAIGVVQEVLDDWMAPEGGVPKGYR